MTKEQHDKLEQFKTQFNNAIKSNFVRMSQGEFNTLATLYTEVTGKTFTRSQMACNNCRMKMVKEIGDLFFQYEAWYEKKYGNRKKNLEDPNVPDQKPVEEGKGE